MHKIAENQADRRAYRRINTDVDATVVLRNERILHCTIRNYCKGGLYLECGDRSSDFDKSEFPTGELLRIRFKAPAEDGGETKFDVVVRVAHAFENGVGCSFVHDEHAALKALSSIPASRREESLAKKRADDNPSATDTNADTHDVVIGLIQDLIRRFFRGQFPTLNIHIKDTLLDNANAAKSNQEQEYYFHASVAVRDNIDMLRDRCIDGCLETLSDLVENRQLPVEAETLDLSSNDLSLVEDNSFEEWVFVSGVVAAAESQLSEELYELAQRLTKLVGHPVDNENNPVSPGVISWLFKDALSTLDVDLLAKKIIYRCFRQSLLDNLGLLYADLNKTLSDHGILEEVPHKITQPERPSAVPGHTHSGNETYEPVVDQTSMSESSGVHANGPMLSGYASPGTSDTGTQRILPSTGEAPPSPQIIGADQVLQFLPELQGGVPGDLAARLLQRVQQDHEHDGTPIVLDKGVQRSIEITDSLIRSFMSDDKLPPALRQSLANLAVPLLRTALKDPDFITDTSHPARRVLDTIDRLAIPLHKEMSYDPHSLEINEMFQSLVRRLGESNGEEEEDVFSDVEGTLEKIAEQQEQAFNTAVRRVIDSCKGENRLYEAKSAVVALLEEKVGSQEIPLILANLLSLGWASLLVLTHLREGPESAEWSRYTEVIDHLLKWLDMSQETPPQQPEKVSGWLETVQSGVSKAPVNPVKIKRTLDSLKKALLGNNTLFQLLKSKRILLDESKIHTIVQYVPAKSLKDLSRSEYGPFISSIRHLQHQDWVMEHLSHGKTQPLQLAWRSDDASRFVFVDGNGHKALDYDAAELAEAMKAKTITVLEDGNLPFVERSFQHLLGQKYDEASAQLTKDHVTGLLNRRAFEKHLTEAIESCWKEKSEHILIILSLDQFRPITDACGHNAAENLLHDISGVLETFNSHKATLAHLGIGEFAILLKDSQKRDGLKFAESERMAINNYIFCWEEHQFNISASIGLTTIDEDTEDIHSAVRNATSAAFIAKENGGNRIKVYDPDDLEMERHRLLTTSIVKIDDAFDNDRLQLFLQPIVPITEGAGLSPHYEVLLRVLNEEGKPIPPGDFIEAAEYYNKMQALDRWVISTLFSWLEENESPEKELGGFSLNLSGQSIGDPAILEFILSTLRASRFPSHKIAFEITETAGIVNQANARDFIEAIRNEGCQIYLDDFGTGLSSYSYLKSYPVDCIKIDGSFIRHILEDETDQAMVKSITEIGHFMNKHIIAEFVENADVLKMLGDIGVDYAQGWGIGQPFPLSNLNNPE